MAELHYHASIQEQLLALSELDEKLGPDELICGWFDDLYFPAQQACPKGYPQETWDRGQREWRECFTTQELAILASFHQVFDQHVEFLIKDPPDWQRNTHWLAVRDAARLAIGCFRSAA